MRNHTVAARVSRFSNEYLKNVTRIYIMKMFPQIKTLTFFNEIFSWNPEHNSVFFQLDFHAT